MRAREGAQHSAHPALAPPAPSPRFRVLRSLSIFFLLIILKFFIAFTLYDEAL